MQVCPNRVLPNLVPRSHSALHCFSHFPLAVGDLGTRLGIAHFNMPKNSVHYILYLFDEIYLRSKNIAMRRRPALCPKQADKIKGVVLKSGYVFQDFLS